VSVCERGARTGRPRTARRRHGRSRPPCSVPATPGLDPARLTPRKYRAEVERLRSLPQSHAARARPDYSNATVHTRSPSRAAHVSTGPHRVERPARASASNPIEKSRGAWRASCRPASPTTSASRASWWRTRAPTRATRQVQQCPSDCPRSLTLRADATLGAMRAAADAQRRANPRDKPREAVRVRAIDQAGHPAMGQRGLFAARALAKGRYVIDYVRLSRRARARRFAWDSACWRVRVCLCTRRRRGS
jgi:hypothetical protein